MSLFMQELSKIEKEISREKRKKSNARFYVVGYRDWEVIACSCENGRPARFDSLEDAIADIRDHLENLEVFGMENDLSWKPVSVRKIKMRELIEACGL